jgi:hypothetical protein
MVRSAKAGFVSSRGNAATSDLRNNCRLRVLTLEADVADYFSSAPPEAFRNWPMRHSLTFSRNTTGRPI